MEAHKNSQRQYVVQLHQYTPKRKHSQSHEGDFEMEEIEKIKELQSWDLSRLATEQIHLLSFFWYVFWNSLRGFTLDLKENTFFCT